MCSIPSPAPYDHGAGRYGVIPTIILLYDGLQQVRFSNISHLIGNSLIQKFLFPAVRLFRLFSGDPSADRSFPEANISGLLMNNMRYKIKS